MDYSDAKASGLTFASVKNKDGNYVAPSPSSASAAADGVTIAPNLTFHAVWGTGAQAYPITYQSWVLVYETQPNANDAAMLKAYIGYLLGDGQQMLRLSSATRRCRPASTRWPQRSSARSAR